MDTLAKAKRVAELALEKNAVDLVLMQVANLCSYTDVVIVCHGRSTRQVQTIVRHVAQEMKHAGLPGLTVEGVNEGLWALVDFGDIVFHAFHEPMRGYYDLEGIWPDAPRIAVEEAPARPAAPRSSR